MKRVSVVGTQHEESGLTSVSGLLAILERLKPEVIFLETPSAALSDYCTGGNLEPAAVRRYCEINRVDLVPVDRPTPPEFWQDIPYLFKCIDRRSPEYRRLMDSHSQNVREYGFAYLNSEACSTHWSNVRGAALAAIEELADGRLTELYERWVGTNELRESHMMTSMEDYCRKTIFSNGVFLVGAAHRQSLIDKSIRWDFEGV